MKGYIQSFKDLLKEYPVEIVTAVQVANPNARCDPPPTWEPQFVVIDYLK